MKPENPPAFPTEWSPGLEPGEAMQTGEDKAQYPGMTLRDHFAGQAGQIFLSAIMAGHLGQHHSGDCSEIAANLAYGFADRMLEARSGDKK